LPAISDEPGVGVVVGEGKENPGRDETLLGRLEVVLLVSVVGQDTNAVAVVSARMVIVVLEQLDEFCADRQQY
jgi:hypothetical protein